jgi:uncharacterized protein (TIGR02996 family)
MYDQHDERQPFLRRIIENPDDDAPRLVYADWLDEHDDPDRARLIRDMFRSSPPYRVHALFPDLPRSFRIAWADGPYVGPCPRWPAGAILRKGFVEEVSVTMRQWMRFGPALALQHPVRHVHLIHRDPVYVPANTQIGMGGVWRWERIPGVGTVLMNGVGRTRGIPADVATARACMSNWMLDLARNGFRDLPVLPSRRGRIQKSTRP